MAFIEDMEMDQKVSQVYNATLEYCKSNINYEILENGVNPNWKIPAQSLHDSIQLDYDGTLLHVAYAKNKIDYFKMLLDHGADFTIKNEHGSSILHHIIENLKKTTSVTYHWVHLDDPFINMILSAHVQIKNSYNPCDKNGLSHLHVACMANHLEAVKFFLNNGTLVDQHINMDSSVNPGFTSLHFAAEFSSFESAQLLLSSGADVHLKNADGITPLHLLVHRRLKILDIRHSIGEKGFTDDFDKEIELNEKIINIILENDTSCCDAADDLGLSNFHIACILQDSLVAGCLSDQVSDINRAVRLDSPICPGYTGLHFAAHCSVDTVMTLIKKGADMMIKDLKGVRPLDICMRWFSLQNIHSVIASVPTWREILFSDGKTKLVDCILAMHTSAKLEEFPQNWADINASLSNDSVLWPGSTMLHLAVVFSERFEAEDSVEADALVRVCLKKGADIHAQDKHGSTPLHLAFRQNKQRVMDYLLQFYVNTFILKLMNLSDKDGLSYLHISSVFADEWKTFTGKLLSITRDMKSAVNATYKGKPLANVKSGWTPLHVAAHCKNTYALNLLMKNCGDILKTDFQGFTAIHLLLRTDSDWLNARNLLDSEALEECVVGSIGLTHLHVASWFNHTQAVKKLLKKGSYIEAVVKKPIEDENLAKFAGCRPLHLAVMGNSKEVVKELLRRGADIFAKKPDSTSPFSEALTGKHHEIADLFMNLLWSDEKLQKSMEKDLGLTMLHIACYSGDVERVKSLLHEGVDVNAKAHRDSCIWPGSSSLHVLMTRAVDTSSRDRTLTNIYAVLDLLLENGADLFERDVGQHTPLQLIFIQYYHRVRQDVYLGNLVLKHQRDFRINPIDNQGLSCFHLACLMRNPEAVEKFLQQGCVDVNRPINFFATGYAGYSPLHLAITDNQSNDTDAALRIVELLLNRGAKVTSENSLGYTPLHILLERAFNRRYNVMQKILGFRNEANVNTTNIYGETPMEKLIKFHDTEIQEIQLFIDHGGRMNACNHVTGEGYMALSLSCERDTNRRSSILQIIMDSREIPTIDDVGRSAIHNAVSSNNYRHRASVADYFTSISQLMNVGCNIDHQDVFGKTALHLAVEFRNLQAAVVLLMCGADFNIVDLSNKSALSYFFEPGTYNKEWDNVSCLEEKQVISRLMVVFAAHIEKLKILRIEVSKCNDYLQKRLIQNSSLKGRDPLDRSTFIDLVDMTKNVKINKSCLTLRSFLCETGAISVYPSLTPEKRQEVTDFFENIVLGDFPDFKYILKLQYRKAVARLSLVAPARDSLYILLSIPLPYLCLEIILSYLPNSDLRNLIDAALIDEDD